MLLKIVTTLLTPVGWMLRGRRAGLTDSVRQAPALTAPRTIEVTSPAFNAGGTIPDRHCAMDLGPNLSPALAWRGVPEGTRQLLLVIEDIDVPFPRPSLHTVALLAPDETSIPDTALTADNPRYRYLPTRGGRTGYFGPRPFPGHGLHRYGFHLYALDVTVPDPMPATFTDLLATVDGHVLAGGFLEGTRRG